MILNWLNYGTCELSVTRYHKLAACVRSSRHVTVGSNVPFHNQMIVRTENVSGTRITKCAIDGRWTTTYSNAEVESSFKLKVNGFTERYPIPNTHSKLDQQAFTYDIPHSIYNYGCWIRLIIQSLWFTDNSPRFSNSLKNCYHIILFPIAPLFQLKYILNKLIQTSYTSLNVCSQDK